MRSCVLFVLPSPGGDSIEYNQPLAPTVCVALSPKQNKTFFGDKCEFVIESITLEQLVAC